jgi:hypothetical protein
MINNIVRWRKSSFSSGGSGACVECAELDPTWCKSSFSGNGAHACIECADLGCTHAIRDSKNPVGPVLTFGQTAWQCLLAAAKARMS